MIRLRLHLFVSGALIVAASASCVNSESPTEPIDKLAGRWVAESPEGHLIEHWTTGAGTILLEGAAYRVHGGDSLLLETLMIETTDSGIYYMAAVRGQNDDAAVGFKLQPSKEGQLVFENPAHDFPKKLTYTFKGSDALQVIVTGDTSSFTLDFRKQ